MTIHYDPEEREELENLARVLPQLSDIEPSQPIRANSIQGLLDSMAGEDPFSGQMEQVFDVALGVRVSQKTGSRVDYFAKRFGMTKAVFLRQMLNEKLNDISHQMYHKGLLEDVKDRLADDEHRHLIEEADEVIDSLIGTNKL